MEATKAVNVLEHRDEIMGRPARSWFQTNDEKEAAAKRSKHEGPTAQRSEAPPPEPVKVKVKRDKYAGLTRKQRRARQRNELFAKDEAEAVEGGGDFRVPDQKGAKRALNAEARGTPFNAKRGAAPSAPGTGKKAKRASGSEAKEDKDKAAPRKIPLSKKAKSHSKAKFSKNRKRSSR